MDTCLVILRHSARYQISTRYICCEGTRTTTCAKPAPLQRTEGLSSLDKLLYHWVALKATTVAAYLADALQ